ncbi:MAG TPA: hypothetical protein ACHBX0_01760 [Arsenophonus sp.]
MSRTDQELQKISEHDRNYVWYFYQYNFSHQLAYNKTAPPGNKYQTEFYSIVNELKTKKLLEENVFAIANARNALIFCEKSFAGEDLKNDILFIALKFYDNYLAIKKDISDHQLAQDCYVLTEIKSLYIPKSIKQEPKHINLAG